MSVEHEKMHCQDNVLTRENACYQIMESPFHYFILLQRGYSEVVSNILRPYNVSKYEWRIIASLFENKELTVTDLAYLTQIDKTRTSRHVECLAQRHLIERTQGKPDRRCAVITLTTQGEMIYAEISPLVLNLKNCFFKGILTEDYTVFLDVLKQAKINCSQLVADN